MVKANDWPLIIEVLKFEQFNKGDCIINWGDEGDKFYIIIKGSVKVLVPSNKIKDAKDLMTKRYQELQNLKEDIIDLERLIFIKEKVQNEMNNTNTSNLQLSVFSKMRSTLKKAYQ